MRAAAGVAASFGGGVLVMLRSCSAMALGAVVVAASLIGGCAGNANLGGPFATRSLTQRDTAEGGSAAKAVAKPSGSTATVASNSSEPVSQQVAHARTLRAKGDLAKAMASLEQARQTSPSDKSIARELGFMALEAGKLDKARVALTASLDASKPDWRTLSALGTVQASDGNQKAAQAHFRRALSLKPDHVATLNNLALSYALEGDLAKAEKTLRSVPGNQSNQKVKENLMLVLALAGKYRAAEKVAGEVLPKEKVASNLAYVKSLTQKGS
ncbi:MAG: tetratricopeptide repeat protein [Hyphomicrobiaceae bacterium]